MQNHNSKIKSDLKQRSYKFSLDLIFLADELSKDLVSRIIIGQLVRCGTSIGANLFEATSSSSKLEFKKYHEISLKSANETKYWLSLLRDSKKADKEKINILLAEVTEIANMLAAGILKMKGKRDF